METQQSISNWAEATFGPAKSTLRVAGRVNEEMAELIRKVTAGDTYEAIAEEVADVAIVFCRLGARLGIDLDAVAAEHYHRYISHWSIEAVVTDINLDLARIMSHLCQPSRVMEMPILLGYGYSGLIYLALLLKTNLQTLIDAKMAINRARQWHVTGGHGYHQRDRSTHDVIP